MILKLHLTFKLLPKDFDDNKQAFLIIDGFYIIDILYLSQTNRPWSLPRTNLSTSKHTHM